MPSPAIDLQDFKWPVDLRLPSLDWMELDLAGTAHLESDHRLAPFRASIIHGREMFQGPRCRSVAIVSFPNQLSDALISHSLKN
jgi:hypothetical protein